MTRKKPTPSAPLSEVAYQQIKDMIVNVTLRPGEQVDEGGLAGSLSIGRTPIREALFRLAAEELLQVRHGHAWVYDRYTHDDTLDALERQARRQGLGLWAQPRPTPPWQWRQQQRESN